MYNRNALKFQGGSEVRLDGAGPENQAGRNLLPLASGWKEKECCIFLHMSWLAKDYFLFCNTVNNKDVIHFSILLKTTAKSIKCRTFPFVMEIQVLHFL